MVTSQPKIPLPTGPLSIDVKYKAKSSYPVIKSLSPEGTVGEQILPPTYSHEQNKTWEILLEKHAQFLKNDRHFCQEYIDGMKKLSFPKTGVAYLKDLSHILKKETGWQIIRVEGLVSPENFFKLLANKLFPCTDFIRHRDEINYTPAPDTFHDQVGHLPMITHPRFANFFHAFGIAGTRARNAEELEWFNRIYWFTVEFGLINPSAHLNQKRNEKLSRIYGSGISSSCEEIEHSLSSKVKKDPFIINIVTETTFDIHHMQEYLFEISSFEELEETFRKWASQKGFLT